MNVVDSSAWLEFFAGTPDGERFREPIQNTAELIVPTVCLFEVTRRLISQVPEDDVLQAIALMECGRVISLDAELAYLAASESLARKLAAIDSIIYATARLTDADLWTQDAHFDGLDRVRFFPKTKSQ